MSEISERIEKFKQVEKMTSDMLYGIEESLRLHYVLTSLITIEAVQLTFEGFLDLAVQIPEHHSREITVHTLAMLNNLFASALKHSETVELSNLTNMCNVIRDGLRKCVERISSGAPPEEVYSFAQVLEVELQKDLQTEAHPYQWN